MTPAELYAFLRKHRLAVISTIGAASPQAAVIGIAVTPALDIIFDTLTDVAQICQFARRSARRSGDRVGCRQTMQLKVGRTALGA